MQVSATLAGNRGESKVMKLRGPSDGVEEESVMLGWDLSLLTSLVPPQSGVCRLCLIKQLNMA